MYLDGPWKPEPPLCLFIKVEYKPRLERLDTRTLALIRSYDTRVSVCNHYLAQAVSGTPRCRSNSRQALGRTDVLPTQMVLVESSLLPCVHSQLKDPATLRHTPLMHGLDMHSLISETRANTHLRSGPRVITTI